MTEETTTKLKPNSSIFPVYLKIRSLENPHRMDKAAKLQVIIDEPTRAILTKAISDIVRDPTEGGSIYPNTADAALVAKFLGLKKEARVLAEMAYEQYLKTGYFLNSAAYVGKGTWALDVAKDIAAEHRLPPLTVLRLQLAALKRSGAEVKKYNEA